jgi:group I intron endonuclease
MASGIYCIENITNGHKYIGQAVDLDKRLGDHWKNLNNNCRDNPYLRNAYNKYGAEVFVNYIIEECPENLLNEREIYYIAIIPTKYPHGYNLTAGGEGLKDPAIEIRQVMSEKKIGNQNAKGHVVPDELKMLVATLNRERIVTEETKTKMSEAQAGNQNAVGYKWTDEQRASLSEVRKGNKNATGYEWTKEQRETLKKAMTGHSVSAQAHINMSKAQEGNKHGLGTHRTKEQRENIGSGIKRAWDRRKQNGPILTTETAHQNMINGQKRRREREAKEKQDGD